MFYLDSESARHSMIRTVVLSSFAFSAVSKWGVGRRHEVASIVEKSLRIVSFI